MARKKSFAKRRLENIERSKRKIKAAINKLPEAPLGSGLGGQAWNLLRRHPDAFVDASSIAFNQETLMRVVVAQEEVIRALESQTGNNALPPRQSIGGTVLEELTRSTPSATEVEAILESMSDEELLDKELVKEVVAEIDAGRKAIARVRPSGRDVIRSSGQFARHRMMPRTSTTSKPKRKPSAYNKRYSAAFKKVEHKFKKKSGGWKKDGFKRAGAAARKLAKK